MGFGSHREELFKASIILSVANDEIHYLDRRKNWVEFLGSTMKKVLAAVTLVAALGGAPALSADMPTKAQVKADPESVAIPILLPKCNEASFCV